MDWPRLIIVSLTGYFVLHVVFHAGRRLGYKLALREVKENESLGRDTAASLRENLKPEASKPESSYRVAALPTEEIQEQKKQSCSECTHLQWAFATFDEHPLPETLYSKPPGRPMCETGEEIFDPVRGKRRLAVSSAVKNKKGNCPDFRKKHGR